LSFVQGPYLQAPIAPAPLIGVTPDLLRQIHILLRNRTRQDFSAYKTSTLQRRIERRKNGEVFPIELSVTEVKVGEDVRYGAFIRDVSEKIKLQEQIIEEERLAAIGSTAAKLGHEIGNPLNGMSLATQLLELRLGELTRAFPRA
jgi:nitrogen-specific signal transduction histidine kinase